MRIRFFALLALLTTAANAQQVATSEPRLPSVEIPAALTRVLRDYERAWEARDVEALSQLFTADGFVLPNGSMPGRGRNFIRQAYTGHGGPLSLRPLAFATHGDTGYIVGAYGGSPAMDDGKFILALKRDHERRWLIMADIDNSNRKSSNAPPAGEQAAVVDAVNRLFAAMRGRDEAALREAVHPRAQIFAVRSEPAKVTIRTAEEFIKGVGAAGEALDERIWQPEVRIDGDIATVWAPYDIRIGTRFSHCGIDSFQLVREDGKWRTVSITYSARTSGCPGPPQ